MRAIPRRLAATAGRRTAVSLVLGILVVGQAACGGSSLASPSAGAGASAAAHTPVIDPTSGPTVTPADSAAGSLDACSLLSPVDLVEGIVGMKMDSATNSGGGWSASDCVWNAASGSFIMSVGNGESFRAFGDPGAPDAQARLAQFRTEMSSTGPPTVEAIGDGAVLFSGAMAAYKGSTYVEVQNLSLTDDQLIRIVKLVIEGLR